MAPTTDRTKKDPEFPELTKIKAYDRQRHVERTLEMGGDREQAEQHADEEVGERNDARD